MNVSASEHYEIVVAVTKLKAQYFRFMDTKDWSSWSDLFTEDAVLENLSHREHPLAGRDTIVDTVSRNLERMVTVHHGHMPEIEVIDSGRVNATWSMEDRLLVNDPSQPGFSLYGFGHYHDHYVLEEKWRIKRIELVRLHVETTSHHNRWNWKGPGGLGTWRLGGSES